MQQSNPKPVMIVFGTRPEVIKLAPIILELEKQGIPRVVCSTGQHRQMLDQMVKIFGLKVDVDLDIMEPNQTLEGITSKVLTEFSKVLDAYQPSTVFVQGDTATAFAAGLAAFYKKIPVAHVEAGLRTNNRYNPFPEEISRRLLSKLATVNFAPTNLSAQNLIRDGVEEEAVFVTGNTVVDALQWVLNKNIQIEDPKLKSIDLRNDTIILVTTHRRENLGDGMTAIFGAIKKIAVFFPDSTIIFPVHLNPAIQKHSSEVLGGLSNVHLLSPLSYTDLAIVMKASKIILTDSGGIQEEAPSLGKPVLVMRETTERPEGVEAGSAKLVGLDEETIYETAHRLLTDPKAYQKMSQATSPYGDGTSAAQIVSILKENSWIQK